MKDTNMPACKHPGMITGESIQQGASKPNRPCKQKPDVVNADSGGAHNAPGTLSRA